MTRFEPRRWLSQEAHGEARRAKVMVEQPRNRYCAYYKIENRRRRTLRQLAVAVNQKVLSSNALGEAGNRDFGILSGILVYSAAAFAGEKGPECYGVY